MPDSEPLPQHENPAPPEREQRRPLSPETSRLIIATSFKELLHPDNSFPSTLKPQFKSEISGKTGKDLPTGAIAEISSESRQEDHDSYENWSDKVKRWYNGQNDEAKAEIKSTFTRLGITVNDRIEQAQIDQFFDNYLDMEGSAEDYKNRYDAFVNGVVDEFLTDGKLDRNGLDKRLEVLKPLLISFGQKDIAAVIEAHIKANGFVSQEVETKNQQAEDALRGVEHPVTDPDSKKGLKKLANKLGVRKYGDPEPGQPPAPPERPPGTPPDHPPAGPPAPPEHPPAEPPTQPEDPPRGPEASGPDDGNEEEHTLGEIAAGKSVQIEGGGHVRQDRLLFAPEDHAFGVFDGVSSSPKSELGAQMCRDFLKDAIQVMPDNIKWEHASMYLQNMILHLNQIIKREPVGEPTLSFSYLWTGPGGEKKLIHFNVGDSRLYRLRNNKLEQVSLDDIPETKGRTEAEQRALQAKLATIDTVDQKRALPPRELAAWQSRNMIGQAMGGTVVEPLMDIIDVEDGDEFLITSDGIHDNLTDAKIQEILTNAADPTVAIKELIQESQIRSRKFGHGDVRAKPDDMTGLVFKVNSDFPEKSAAKSIADVDPNSIFGKYLTQIEQANMLISKAATGKNGPLSSIEQTYVMLSADPDMVKKLDIDKEYKRMLLARKNRLEHGVFESSVQRLAELRNQGDTTSQEYTDIVSKLKRAEFSISSADELAVFVTLFGVKDSQQMLDKFNEINADPSKPPNAKLGMRISFRKNDQDVTEWHTKTAWIPAKDNEQPESPDREEGVQLLQNLRGIITKLREPGQPGKPREPKRIGYEINLSAEEIAQMDQVAELARVKLFGNPTLQPILQEYLSQLTANNAAFGAANAFGNVVKENASLKGADMQAKDGDIQVSPDAFKLWKQFQKVRGLEHFLTQYKDTSLSDEDRGKGEPGPYLADNVEEAVRVISS